MTHPAFTDTHCHLAHPALRQRLPEVFAEALAENVGGLIVPSAERSDWQTVLTLAKLPHVRAVALGLHPWYAKPAALWDLAELCRLLPQHPRALVGEIGLDFYDKTLTPEQRALQIQIFEAQLDLAQRHQRPVILHNLRAGDTLLHSIRRCRFRCGGIVHAFSGSIDEAQQFIKHGFQIGIGTLVLNPNARKTRFAAANLPLPHLVLETDSPFGKPDNGNTPAALHHVAQTVAQLRGITLAELARQTEQNLNRLLP